MIKTCEGGPKSCCRSCSIFELFSSSSRFCFRDVAADTLHVDKCLIKTAFNDDPRHKFFRNNSKVALTKILQFFAAILDSTTHSSAHVIKLGGKHVFVFVYSEVNFKIFGYFTE